MVILFAIGVVGRDPSWFCGRHSQRSSGQSSAAETGWIGWNATLASGLRSGAHCVGGMGSRPRTRECELIVLRDSCEAISEEDHQADPKYLEIIIRNRLRNSKEPID